MPAAEGSDDDYRSPTSSFGYGDGHDTPMSQSMYAPTEASGASSSNAQANVSTSRGVSDGYGRQQASTSSTGSYQPPRSSRRGQASAQESAAYYHQAQASGSGGYEQQFAQGPGGYEQQFAQGSGGYNQQLAQGSGGYYPAQVATSPWPGQPYQTWTGSSTQALDGRQHQLPSLSTGYQYQDQRYDERMPIIEDQGSYSTPTATDSGQHWPRGRQESLTPTVDRQQGYSTMQTEHGHGPPPALSSGATDNGSYAGSYPSTTVS